MYEEKDMLNDGQTTTSRSEKILEAKSSFYATQASAAGKRNDHNSPKRGGHPFGMIRMLMAGMLFLILVTAFHFQVSYGFLNKDNIEMILSDDSHWRALVEEVSEVIKYEKNNQP